MYTRKHTIRVILSEHVIIILHGARLEAHKVMVVSFFDRHTAYIIILYGASRAARSAVIRALLCACACDIILLYAFEREG